MKENNEFRFDKEKMDELKESLRLDALFEGLAEGTGLNVLEAKKAAMIIFIHNTADFIKIYLYIQKY